MRKVAKCDLRLGDCIFAALGAIAIDHSWFNCSAILILSFGTRTARICCSIDRLGNIAWLRSQRSLSGEWARVHLDALFEMCLRHAQFEFFEVIHAIRDEFACSEQMNQPITDDFSEAVCVLYVRICHNKNLFISSSFVCREEQTLS
jgi:hypothetical protein